MDDPRARLVVPAPSRRLPRLEIPFRLGGEPFTADPLPTLVAAETRELCVMAWGTEEADPEIEATLVDAAGGEHDLPLAGEPRVVPDTDAAARYVVALEPPRDIPKGRYRLRLELAALESDPKPRSEIDVVVR
jgi:hypothetical protein